jgi:hypothetical protein
MKGGEILKQLSEDKFLFFLLGDSPASEFYVPTFRNTIGCVYYRRCTYEDGTVFRDVGI